MLNQLRKESLSPVSLTQNVEGLRCQRCDRCLHLGSLMLLLDCWRRGELEVVWRWRKTRWVRWMLVMRWHGELVILDVRLFLVIYSVRVHMPDIGICSHLSEHRRALHEIKEVFMIAGIFHWLASGFSRAWRLNLVQVHARRLFPWSFLVYPAKTALLFVAQVLI